jgi:ABC-2 type transport system permease protein
MNKIWIVLKSEFLRRVKSKWFIVATLVAPLVLIALAVLPALLAMFAFESSERTIVVVDETGVLFPRLAELSSEAHRLVEADRPVEAIRREVEAGAYDGYIELPSSLLDGEGTATFYSARGGGLSLQARLEHAVNRAVEAERLAERSVPPEVMEILRAHVPVRMVKISSGGDATIMPWRIRSSDTSWGSSSTSPCSSMAPSSCRG